MQNASKNIDEHRQLIRQFFLSTSGELKGSGTNGGALSRISVFFVIIGGFMLRLTILLLKAVLAFFLRQERYLLIHTCPLVDAGVFYASIPLRNHHSGQEPFSSCFLGLPLERRIDVSSSLVAVCVVHYSQPYGQTHLIELVSLCWSRSRKDSFANQMVIVYRINSQAYWYIVRSD